MRILRLFLRIVANRRNQPRPVVFNLERELSTPAYASPGLKRDI